jgi:hypothetical protein
MVPLLLLRPRLRACFAMLDMSTLLCFRGPSGSDAISPNPFKISTAHFERGSETDIRGIFKTPSNPCVPPPGARGSGHPWTVPGTS